jgi:hypothetical protein
MTLKNRCSMVGGLIYGLAALTLLYCGGHSDCRYGGDALFVVSLPSSLLLLPAEWLVQWLPSNVGEALASIALLVAPFLNGALIGRFAAWVWEAFRERDAQKRAAIARQSLHTHQERVK